MSKDNLGGNMANKPITIELPEDLIDQLQAANLLADSAFLSQALTAGLAMQSKQVDVTDMLAALDELDGLCLDASWTMDDVLAMKREERAIEERKLNRW